MRLRVKNQINDGSPASTASTNQTTSRRVESAITMARFSIGEDDDDTSLANKRPRFAEPASQSQPRSQRSVPSPPPPPFVADEDEEFGEFIVMEEVESDSQGSEEEEDDEDDEVEAEAVEEEDDDEEDEDVGSDEDGFTEVQPLSEGQNGALPVRSSHIGLSNTTASMKSSSTPPPVFNNAIGALQVVLTDPDVLDCPICLDPLFSPVFQCENGHIACSTCCQKVKRKCPSCCMPIGYNRCRAIEKVLESVKISCKNTPYGCKESIPYSKKNDHEQTCLHTKCCCPISSCPFIGSSKNLNLHFGIQHSASTTRFTYNATFIVNVETNKKHIFLQEQHESVIFIINHEAKQHGRVLNVDCVGPSLLKTSFLYQLTVKNMETSLSLQSVPEIYAEWCEHGPVKNYLIAPTEFVGYNGVLSLHVCIKKAVFDL
ncbi:hypothetical protein Lser_V15G19827 [Lactuca serriola]